MPVTKIDTFALRRLITRDEFDYPLLTSVLSGYTGIRQKINRLLSSGVIIRVKKGIYVFGQDYRRAPICLETLANLIFGPSCLSLEYALHHYGVIPERVETLTSVTPNRNKRFKTALGTFSYRHLDQKKYPVGVERVMLSKDQPALMASLEKALCDYIILNRRLNIQTENDANQFLERDLRIDPAHWTRFKPLSMRKINTIYRSSKVQRIIEFLENQELP